MLQPYIPSSHPALIPSHSDLIIYQKCDTKTKELGFSTNRSSPLGAGHLGRVFRSSTSRLAIKKSEHSLLEEYRIGSLLNHHGFMKVFRVAEKRFGLGESVFKMEMELVDGRTLFSLKNLSLKNYVKIVKDSYECLKHLYEKNVVWEDLGPKNVMVDDQFNVKFIDFGMYEVNTNKDKLLEELLRNFYCFVNGLNRTWFSIDSDFCERLQKNYELIYNQTAPYYSPDAIIQRFDRLIGQLVAECPDSPDLQPSRTQSPRSSGSSASLIMRKSPI